MARKGGNPKKAIVVLSSFLVFLAVTAAVVFLFFRKPDEFVNLAAFPIDSYMDGKDLWSREDYKVEGRVDNVIMRSASGEKLLVSIQPKGSDLRLPVLMDRSGGTVPVQREQNLVLRVKLDGSSQIQCLKYERR